MFSEVREQADWGEGRRKQDGWEVARGVILGDMNGSKLGSRMWVAEVNERE